ncbi:MAG TPA: DUF2666 family protein [Candidatus Saccharimonadales bacterium]|nr:DUF2666 family protein [Candidatus Saccharimonadales bacterium]
MEGTDSIEFSAKWKEWVVIKRTTIRDDTKPEEVVFSMASIRQTIDRKAFELLGIDTKTLDDYATAATAGMKKNFKDLGNAVQSLSSAEAKAAVEKSCASKPELGEVAKTYLFRKVVQALGFDFDVNQEMLSKIYPNLKLPKPRGRQPKK